MYTQQLFVINIHKKPQFEFNCVHSWDSHHVGMCNVAFACMAAHSYSLAAERRRASSGASSCSTSWDLLQCYLSPSPLLLHLPGLSPPDCSSDGWSLISIIVAKSLLQLNGRLRLPLPSFPSPTFLNGGQGCIAIRTLPGIYSGHLSPGSFTDFSLTPSACLLPGGPR